MSLSAWEVCERFKCAGSGVQPENQEGYVFMVKEKVRRGDHPLPQPEADVRSFVSSSFDPTGSDWNCHGAAYFICLLAKGQ